MRSWLKGTGVALTLLAAVFVLAPASFAGSKAERRAARKAAKLARKQARKALKQAEQAQKAALVKLESILDIEPEGGIKNVILFLGDGMGVSTVTAARILSVGVDGKLVLDQMPFTALSRTATTDHITPDSAGTMTAIMTGVNTNNGVIGLSPDTERADFNHDGNGDRLVTMLEIAKQMGKKVGVVTTARVTHATPAACYAHVNERNLENDIALQALPTDPTYNTLLGTGIDVLMGGGRRFFVPNTTEDEEGNVGSRTDGRDLRNEFQSAGYDYAWNRYQMEAFTSDDLPVLGLFESSHMEYEYDRRFDLGGEPSLTEMVEKSIELLDNPNGYLLIVEGGRIDHGHHASNAWRALTDTEEFDRAVGEAIHLSDLEETLILATADHSHVFNIAGYPLRPWYELPYLPAGALPDRYRQAPFGGLMNTVYDLSSSGEVTEVLAGDDLPYTVLVYANGPGYRDGRRDPSTDTTNGLDGRPPGFAIEGQPAHSNDPEYLQESAVPLGSESHAGEDVAIYGIGAWSHLIRGTVKNTYIFEVMKKAFGL